MKATISTNRKVGNPTSWLQIVGLVLVAAYLVGCAKGTSDGPGSGATSELSEASELDSGIRNQKPGLYCEIKDTATGALLRVLSTNVLEDRTIAGIQRGVEVTIDCSKTTDDLTALSDLKFDYNFGNGDVVSNAGAILTRTFSSLNVLDFSVSVSDEGGEVRTKGANIYVECTQAEASSLAINENAITVTKGTNEGEFHFSAAGAASGGPSSPSYRYNWDFNGDGYSDSGQNASPLAAWNNPLFWSSDVTLSNVYTQFAGYRQISLSVFEQNCNMLRSVKVTRVFGIERVAAGSQIPVSIIKPDHFVQADIRSTNGSPELGASGDFISRQPIAMSTARKRRVSCGYNRSKVDSKASMSIRGFHWYDRDDNSLAEHGLSFEVYDILDNGSVGLQRLNSSASQLRMANARYRTPESQDGITRVTYQQVGNCTLEMTIERADAVVPCNSDPGAVVKSDVVILNGKYSCPKLTVNGAANGDSIELQEGYFFCERQITNACPGGGGGGGGGQPPVPM
ncbi:MAG: hypothetical protein COT74_13755 [Bdellovibrionales bacterium CG10_big_fil_rev_8_21_14_0_10_45_34]|nr:MAG: hypothetical protein COT74_13755 [Bdellovibrionales bacterium CG10_big_fil_rev_8_21_14_0_10_45_34]